MTLHCSHSFFSREQFYKIILSSLNLMISIPLWVTALSSTFFLFIASNNATQLVVPFFGRIKQSGDKSILWGKHFFVVIFSNVSYFHFPLPRTLLCITENPSYPRFVPFWLSDLTVNKTVSATATLEYKFIQTEEE